VRGAKQTQFEMPMEAPVILPILAAAAGPAGGSGGALLGWFDAVALAVVLAGFWRGRKRGMSLEAMDLLQWGAIIGAGAVLYAPLGQLLSSTARFSLLFSYVLTYLTIAIVVKSLCSLFKRSVGEKLVSNETFGSLEYYLGMGAGMVRFACVLLFALALLHAPLYTTGQMEAEEKAQQHNFGDIRFPTLGRVQRAVFANSFLGHAIEQNLSFLLIQATPQSRPLDSINRARDREYERSLGL